MLGIIMLSFVGTEGGFLGSGASGIAEGGPMVQLVIQLKGILVIGLWTAVASRGHCCPKTYDQNTFKLDY